MAAVGFKFLAKLVEEAYGLLKDEVVLLSGAASEIGRLQDSFRSMQLVMADADRRRIEEGAVNKWLMDLKDLMYDADDILDECRVKAEKHKALSSTSARFSPFPYFHKISWGYQIKRRIENVNPRLNEIAAERSKFGFITEFRACPPQISRKTSHLPDPDVVGSGIEEDTNKLVELLIKDGQNEKLAVHSVVGIGGIGKTTVAWSVYNDERITAHFKIKMWLSITKEFTEVDLLRSIARMLFKQYPFYCQSDLLSQNVSRDCFEPVINDVVRGRRFFIVLDDLWSGEVWYDLLRNPLQGGTAGSRILITTRNVGIAKDGCCQWQYPYDAINVFRGGR
ncbi:hypothetical protein LUZ60_016806 [Juncus effusus]|nr:hypothetical protein LUZ60_016806 [Juncus effusus]